MFGVSPACVFSLYGTGFTVPDFCDALPRIKRLSFEAFQPEIYVANATGHAWACPELVPLLPYELRRRIFGTHLGDNRSTEKGDRA